ncbi:MAG: hypothetical protein EOO73_26065 [Myxococcales bacterium]|nr:MAG: hypothetical protein EOO73_26065 [Myxococcales bacterium]
MKAARGLLAALLPLACSSGAEGPVFPTSERFPESSRAAPSFAAEVGLSSPAVPSDSSEAARGLRVVRMPLDSEAARDQVSRFFIAVLQESTRELFPLFAAQASVVSEGNRQPAQAVWRARFAQLDYTILAGRVVAAPQTLRTYTWDSAARAKADGVPAPASPSEVVVVARPGLSWTGKSKLFGESLAFRLRAKNEGRSGREPGFEIAEIAEDFRLP